MVKYVRRMMIGQYVVAASKKGGSVRISGSSRRSLKCFRKKLPKCILTLNQPLGHFALALEQRSPTTDTLLSASNSDFAIGAAHISTHRNHVG